MNRISTLVRNSLPLMLLFGLFCNAQYQCPTIEIPLNGEVNVPVDTEVSWNVVPGINGYSVSLGTSPGASDILNSRSAALVNYLVPMVGLPDNTEIFVTISLFLEDGTFVSCPTESFTTEVVTTAPDCTSLISTLSNTDDVTPGADIEWKYSPTATGYRLAIGTAPNTFDILTETDVGNVLSFALPDNLPTQTEIFVRITPYNDYGAAQSCEYGSFTTGDSNIDCEMFNPEIDIPDIVGICRENSQITVSSNIISEGYQWYKINGVDDEVLISEMNTVTISDIGQYRFEAFNNVSILGDNAKCSSSKVFNVVYSEPATIRSVNVTKDISGLRLQVDVAGPGNYEYSLDQEAGPYQDSNIFYPVPPGDHKLYVRDKNGCGIIEYLVDQSLSKEDFPKFFTPNNDGANDYWKISAIQEYKNTLETTYIFDRYGILLAQFPPESKGWDGSYNGIRMPSSTYWFLAFSKDGRKVQGYFSLVR